MSDAKKPNAVADCQQLVFYLGAAMAMRSGETGPDADRARATQDALWRLLPLVKALWLLAEERPERADALYADQLQAPMPFGLPPDRAAEGRDGGLVTFEELSELSRWAAARAAVDLGPVISLWKKAIALGCMTDAEACAKWARLSEESAIATLHDRALEED